MTSENLLVTIVSPLVLNNRLFANQTQYCYIRTVVIPSTRIIQRTVGIGNWCAIAAGSEFSALSIDGVVYSYYINFQTASEQDFIDFLAWLNGLGKGTFVYVQPEIPPVEQTVCFQLQCTVDNGLEYDPQWLKVNGLVTEKGTCDVDITVPNCCNTGSTYYVVKVDGVEYYIPEDNGALGYECIDETFIHSFYNTRLFDQTKDYDAPGLPKRYKPNTCKLEEEANKVFM